MSCSPAATDPSSRSALSARRSVPVWGLSGADIVPVWEAVHAVSRRRAARACKNADDPTTGEQVPVSDAARLAPSAVAGDNPQAYLPGDRRRALAEGRSLPDRVQGAAVFADISGFTPLTEALVAELGPQRGAEELTAALNAIIDPLLTELDRHGGDVIYFSGDAVTAWIDGDDGAQATACALAMQELMTTVGERTTPGG